MIARLIRLVKDPTSKNIIINTGGNYLNVFFVIFFSLILFRTLKPVEMGIFSVLMGISYVLSTFLEFGTTATIYSTVPVLYQEGDSRLFTFIKSTFVYQTVLSVIVIIFLAAFFPFLDKIFFKTGAENWVLMLTASTIIMFVWQNFLTNILFSAGKFFRANLYLNISNLVKAGILIFLAKTGNITVPMVILTYGLIGPFIYFMMALFKSYDKIPSIQKAEVRRGEIKTGYTMTYFVASQFYNIGIRADLFLLSYFALGEQIGFYASGQKIILSIIATVVSISQVLSPQFASIKSNIEMKKLFKKAFAYMLIPVGIFAALFFTPDFLFRLILTNTFDKAIGVTKLLGLVYIINPLSTILMLYLLYTVKKPVYILASNIIFFAIVSAGSYFLIPKYGMFGPPYAVFGAFLGATLIQLYAVFKEYKSKA